MEAARKLSPGDRVAVVSPSWAGPAVFPAVHELAMRRVILPQTFRRLIPPLVNELAALSKDTSLVMVIALPEMLYETKQLAGTYLRPEVYAWAALGYLIIVVALSTLARSLERRLEARDA